MLENKWDAVPPQLFTANGTAQGLVQVADTAGFRVKQCVWLRNNTFASTQPVPVQVKRVLSTTLLIVGTINNAQIASWMPLDISAFTVASGAYIGAEQQEKSALPGPDAHYNAVYETDPVVADRVVQVDKYGNFYDSNNPMPIVFDGTIAIGSVEIKGPSGDVLVVNPGGSINVNVVSVPVVGNIVVNQYGEANSVVSGSTTTVVQYVTPMGLTQAILQRISVSGENIAKWTVFVNGTQIDTRRTFYGSSLSEYFEFTTGNSDGFSLSPGDIVAVKVLHTKPYVGDFEGRIQVYQIA
jgi:hypothetical protein